MAYTFTPHFESSIADNLEKVIAVDKFFLLGIDHLTYLYAEEEKTMGLINEVCESSNQSLNFMADSDLKILLKNKPRYYKCFRGSVILFNKFIESAI